MERISALFIENAPHDNSIRVPMIIYDPRIKKHRDVDDMVLNIDIASTILDIADTDVPEKYQFTPWQNKNEFII